MSICMRGVRHRTTLRRFVWTLLFFLRAWSSSSPVILMIHVASERHTLRSKSWISPKNDQLDALKKLQKAVMQSKRASKITSEQNVEKLPEHTEVYTNINTQTQKWCPGWTASAREPWLSDVVDIYKKKWRYKNTLNWDWATNQINEKLRASHVIIINNIYLQGRRVGFIWISGAHCYSAWLKVGAPVWKPQTQNEFRGKSERVVCSHEVG